MLPQPRKSCPYPLQVEKKEGQPLMLHKKDKKYSSEINTQLSSHITASRKKKAQAQKCTTISAYAPLQHQSPFAQKTCDVE